MEGRRDPATDVEAVRSAEPARAPGLPSRPRPLLELQGVGKSFGSKVVLKAASFPAEEGRITALMGRNGAGKTTMFRIVVGRLRPDYGAVFLRGRFLARPTLALLAREGVMYSTQASALTRLFTVRDHFRAFMDTFGGESRFDGVVDEMRLDTLLDRRPTRISGGERQRVSLGLALVRGPACLLMDEPFAGVAPADRPLVARGLRLLRAQGAAVVISGHDVEDVFSVSDQILWVTAGTTHWLGSPGEAARHDQFRRDYLGPRAPGASLPGSL